MKQTRIHVVDALRGFALAGIVLVHMVENYIGAPPPPEAMAAANQGILDAVVQGFIGLFLQGKFFALFSFLFGLSFFIQMDKASAKNKSFAGRFLWRLVLLAVFGMVHQLFYRGDILTVYALLGVLLIPFYKISNKWASMIVALLFLGLGRYIVFLVYGQESIFSGIKLEAASPEIAAYFNILKEGSIREVFLSNAVEGILMKLDFQFGVFGRGYLTFGFFLLGLLAGKLQFFTNFRSLKKKMKTGLLWSLVGFLVSMAVMIGLFVAASGGGQSEVSFDNWTSIMALTAFDLSNIFMTAMIIFGFLMIFIKLKGQRVLIKFAPYGRMALSNYIGQSIIGTFLLYGWGLGFLGELRNISTFGIGILVIVLQMLFSSWWLKRFAYGPLEWLWRSLTFFKLFPFRKQDS